MPADTAPLRFAFKGKLVPRNQEMVREVVTRGFMNMDFDPLTPQLSMQVETRFLPGITLTDARASPHRATAGHDLSRGSDDFVLIWSTSRAMGSMRQLGKDCPSDGSAYLLSCADRITCETRETFRHVTLKLERDLLRPLLPGAEAAFGRMVPPHSEPLRLLKGYLDSYRALTAAPAGADPRLARTAAVHIADLVALALGTGGDAAEQAGARGLRAARLEAVKRWVLAHLSSPELNVGAAAQAVGLGPRSVQLLFESEGDTFTAYVLRERLALARHRLSLPGAAGQSVAHIAYGCGFGDLSYFTNTFRRAYGQTPTDVRRASALNSRAAHG